MRLELPDQPDAKRLWWFVNDGQGCELCVNDPGHEVDLYLAATLADMIYIVRGDLKLKAARDTGRLEAHGARTFCRRLESWLNLGPLTKIRSARAELSA